MVKQQTPMGCVRETSASLGLAFAAGLFASVLSLPAQADEASASAELDTSSMGSEKPASEDAQAILLGGKIGGIMPFSGLGPFVAGGIELGYIFPGTKQRIGALLDVGYTVPRTDGSESDARVASGKYTWKVTQKQLTFQPTFIYRLTGGNLVPFAGIGPRIYFLQTTGEGESGGETLLETDEQSTKFGFGIPLGAEFKLGPGALMAELMFEWAPLDHRITGDSTLAAINLLVGYRFYL